MKPDFWFLLSGFRVNVQLIFLLKTFVIPGIRKKAPFCVIPVFRVPVWGMRKHVLTGA